MHKQLRTTAAFTAALLCGALLALDAGIAAAQATEYVMKDYDKAFAGDAAWKDITTIPPGAKMVLVYGDPKQEGPYVIRVKLPAGYKLPAHKHPDARTVTVLQGTYWSGVGEQFEQSKLQKFTWGSFYTTEPNVPHFTWAETDVIIQEMGQGPVSNSIEYMDASQDPRKK
jgi:quercetin dioxygenase-like cupin family protein